MAATATAMVTATSSEVAQAIVDVGKVHIGSGIGYTLQAQGWTVYHVGPEPTKEEVQACLMEHRLGNPMFFPRLAAVEVTKNFTKPISHKPRGYPLAQYQSELSLFTR